MAVIIGRTKSWVWWLGGLLCALVWGRSAQAGTRREPPQPPYGVATPVRVEVTRKAEKLVEEYANPVAAAKPSAKVEKQIAELIANFSAADLATRDAASSGIVKHGPAALGELRKARGGKDAEVVQRAKAAIAAIEAEARKGIVASLKKLGAAGRTAVNRRWGLANREAARASADLAKLRKLAATGEVKDKEVEKFRAHATSVRERARLMGSLRAQVAPAPVAPRKPQSLGEPEERLARVERLERQGASRP